MALGLALLVVGCRAEPPPRRSFDELLSQTVLEAAGSEAVPTGHAGDPGSSLKLAAHHEEPLPEGPATSRPAPDLQPLLPPAPVPSDQPGDSPPPGAQFRVNEIFQETDVREAIQALAAQAHVSVIVDERVSGLTSAFIEDELFEAALRKVLLPLGCVYCWRLGQCLIGVPDPESSLFPLIAVRFDYRPLHLSPEELAASLPERYRKYLRLAEKRNRILIEAPADLAARILMELERSDQPVPQVVLEAFVCVFSPEARLRFGLDVEHGVGVGPAAFPNLRLSQLALGGTVSPVTLAGMFSDFAITSAFLQLLAQEGYVEIRAAPRVMAKDGEKAQITIARETFFSIQPNAEILFRQDIERVEAGITLDILPVVRGDMVTVGIERAEVSEQIRGPDDGTRLASDFPVINRRWVSTTVHVKDGQTIVIGGLTHRQMVDRVSKIPYVSDLPCVGGLFTRVEQDEQETEVVIFLSPRIVHAPPEGGPLLPLPPMSQANDNRSPPEPAMEPGSALIDSAAAGP